MKLISRTLAILVLLVTAAFAANTNYGNFSIDAPVTLKNQGTSQDKTDDGSPYTKTEFFSTMPNSDMYMVDTATYSFVVTNKALLEALNGFAKGANAKVISTENLTLDGRYAVAALLSTTSGGREIRFALVITSKVNTMYMLLFATYLDVQGTDNNAVAQFFSSFEAN